MSIHIAIHSLPHEIDQLEQLLIQLKRNSIHLPKDHGIKVEVCLNMNLTDWNSSLMKKKFFRDKLENLVILTESWAPNSSVYFDDTETIMGCNDIRRQVIRSTEEPYVMYLDTDNIFAESFLSTVLSICQLYKLHCDHNNGYEYVVLTPQTTRMWDSTWDVITNQYHMTEEASHDLYDKRDPYEAVMLTSTKFRNATRISGFKFAGWGTVISTKLARLIDIPDSLGSYGVDDTFIMMGCYILKDKGYDVHQWVLDNEIIIENNLFRFNPYKDCLVNIDRRQEFLANAHIKFNPELEKLKNRL